MSRQEPKDIMQELGFLDAFRGVSRRSFLKSAAAVGASTLLPAGAATMLMGQATSPIKSPTELPKLARIDIHGHFTPPILIETMGAEELGGFAKWTPEKALEEMEYLWRCCRHDLDSPALRSRHGG